MKAVTCARCKVQFALSEETHTTLVQSSANFFCPFGHSQHFPQGPSEADLLRKRNETLQQQMARVESDVAFYRERSQAEARSAAAFKGVATRMKNRVAKGVCPCCNRSFANLQAHMETKHKGFAQQEVTIQ